MFQIAKGVFRSSDFPESYYSFRKYVVFVREYDFSNKVNFCFENMILRSKI